MPNRLSRETSPYLQQHANNPVDWYPWGEEALAEARRTGKPILLSVGYSACHWCHVMAHESFENESIARVMNELFVNVKVDREERPDIDGVYMLAHSMITQQSGGWPLTMFLTAEQVPFFGGTYFPPDARQGQVGFPDLLKRVRQYHDENPGDIRAAWEQFSEAMAKSEPAPADGSVRPTREPLDAAADDLLGAFDHENGGFSGPPKFPHPHRIELLLRRHAADRRDEEALDMATFTLRRMAEGGINDQLGGGFARYSTDASWTIPHFEKMLYDNGQLLRLYADAWAATREPAFAAVCIETAAWVQREMQAPEGGYYSSLDADSESHEGRFYVWQAEEVRALLEPAEFDVAESVYGLDKPRNFEATAWHLRIVRPLEDAARALGIDEAAARARLDSARRKLLAARDKRVRPGRDDKVLTSWNGLMIRGMAHAGRVLGQEDWIDSARRALDFIRREMWREGRLLATYKDGRAHLEAYLDDHAYLLAALVEMMQARFDPADLAWAIELGDALLGRFMDRAGGGFWFTAHGHETLVHRQKPGNDTAQPSGNGIAALALNRLAFLTGEEKYAEAMRDTLAVHWPRMLRQPTAHGSLLAALEEFLEPPTLVVVRGPSGDLAPWRRLLDAAHRPTTLALYLPTGAAGIPPTLDKPAGATVNAWVCRGVTCLPPIDRAEKLREALELPTMPANPPLTPRSFR